MNLERIEFYNDSPLNIKIQSVTNSPIHWHEDVTEIILPIKGTVKIKANFEQVTLEEGEFFFINNKTIHALKSDEEAIVILFYIKLDYFQEQFQYIKHMFFRNSISEELLGINEVDQKVKERFKIYFRNRLINIFIEEQNKSISNEMFDELIHKLVYQMIYEFNWLQLLKDDGDFINSIQLDRYHRIVKYIDENYSERIYLHDIVSREFISKTYFSHFWKNLSTYSFNERINYERVLKSEFLLFQNMTISDISAQCGFSDIKYYYKTFKKWYGCMPLEHRAKCSLYESQGYKYKDLDYSLIASTFKNYTDKFFLLHDDINETMDFATLLDKYFYLKYYHTIHKQSQSNNSTYLLLDPFKYTTFDKDKKDIVINWSTFDLLMNLVIDFKFTLQIKFNSNELKRDEMYKFINLFLDKLSARYGIKVIKDFQFLVNYKDSLAFENNQTIEQIITKKIGKVNISYYIEP